MLKLIYQSLVSTFLLAALTCGVYPLLITVLGQTFFGAQASGSLIAGADGKPIGSALIGQSFSRPEYFHGRPSAAGASGYDASSSSGSNLGPTNQKFADGLKSAVEGVLKDNPALKKGEIPVDLVTFSASGLDPHVSPEGIAVQAERVAGARHTSREQILALVESAVEGPQWGIFGESVVNVLAMNLELDRRFPLQK